MRHASNPAPPEILIFLKVYGMPMKYHEIGMAKFHKVFTRFRKIKVLVFEISNDAHLDLKFH